MRGETLSWLIFISASPDYGVAMMSVIGSGVGVDVNRFLDTFRRFSSVGWVEGYGSTRVALSEAHITARRMLMDELSSLGARVYFDEAGNLFGVLGNPWGSIAIGSHTDSVPGGGRFDGIYGVIAGLEVLRIIRSSGVRLRHGVMLIDFNNEEGSRWSPPLLGSGLSAGVYSRDYVYSRLDREGKSFGDALRDSGFMGGAENNLVRNPPRFYVELHVEQGPELEMEGYDIGIPEGIAGIRVLELRYEGGYGHAASHTRSRRDALKAFSRLYQEVWSYFADNVGRVRITIGSLTIEPGIYNVVPRRAIFTIDIRSYEEEMMREAESYIIRKAGIIASEEGLELKHRTLWNIERADFDREVIGIIEDVCRELGLKYKRMWSWAGHDAKNMARISRTAMIFVPSVGGISHSKEEYTRDRDLVNGLLVLLKTVLRLDKI